FFNEYIKTDNPTSQIVTIHKISYEKGVLTALKNRLLIKLNQELEDSTTYVFNFQKSIKDITESNPANQLKLVFSTGNEIDSLKFSGSISYIFPQKEIGDVLVGLYHLNDTTVLFTVSQYYIAQAALAVRLFIFNY